METTILWGVLNKSDGNASHAVAIHGGFMFYANEVVALPLCQDALDNCCSTNAVVVFGYPRCMYVYCPKWRNMSNIEQQTEVHMRIPYLTFVHISQHALLQE